MRREPPRHLLHHELAAYGDAAALEQLIAANSTMGSSHATDRSIEGEQEEHQHTSAATANVVVTDDGCRRDDVVVLVDALREALKGTLCIRNVQMASSLSVSLPSSPSERVECPKFFVTCDDTKCLNRMVLELLYLPDDDDDDDDDDGNSANGGETGHERVAVRLRVIDEDFAVRHPLVHPETLIFQQQTAREMLRRPLSAVSSPAADVLGLFVDTVLLHGSTLEGLTSLSMSVATQLYAADETVALLWHHYDSHHHHHSSEEGEAGDCGGCCGGDHGRHGSSEHLPSPPCSWSTFCDASDACGSRKRPRDGDEIGKENEASSCLVSSSASSFSEKQLAMLAVYRDALLHRRRSELTDDPIVARCFEQRNKLQRWAGGVQTAAVVRLLRDLPNFSREKREDATMTVLRSFVDPAVLPVIALMLQSRDDVGTHREGTDGVSWDSLIRRECEGVFSVPLFTPEFCEMLAKDIVAFEDDKDANLLHSRPNSMNHYGVVLSEMGLSSLAAFVCETVLFHLCRHFAPLRAEWTRYMEATKLMGTEDDDGDNDDELLRGAVRDAVPDHLDTHHSFIVHYSAAHDHKLDMHSDDSEVTFNVNLRNACSGSTLTFCGLPGTMVHRKHRPRSEERHEVGRAVFHLGALRHGAAPIAGGERMNLIFWLRSSWLRQHLGGPPLRFFHPNEESPDRICMSSTHDPDYNDQVSK